MRIFIIFVILNVLNVIIQTIKSIATIKCGKLAAAFVNAAAYGLYTVVLVYMNCDLNLWAKVAVVAGANLIGVYVVKAMEEKARKDKLWKVEATIPKEQFELNKEVLDMLTVPHNYIYIENGTKAYYLVNFYCSTQKDSRIVKEYLLDDMNAKYFVSESKTL